MAREISAGGVVLRAVSGVSKVALIEPQKENQKTSKTTPPKAILALPKGLVDQDETPEAAAVREVHEETGVTGESVAKLGDIRYVYVRSWGDGARVFKIVSFYLLRYVSGEIDDIEPAMRIEVKRALWVPIAEAARQLAHSNERKVVRLAEQYLEKHGLIGFEAAPDLRQ